MNKSETSVELIYTALKGAPRGAGEIAVEPDDPWKTIGAIS